MDRGNRRRHPPRAFARRRAARRRPLGSRPAAWLAALACGAALTAVTLALADQATSTTDYESASGATYTSVHPTGVGLPQLGVATTFGAGEMGAPLRAYHDYGAYGRDLAAVDGAAGAYLDQRLDERANPPRATRVCHVRYRRVAHRGRIKLYRRVRRCVRRAPPALPAGKPAITLDIDETSLSNYSALVTTNFLSSALALTALLGTDTAIAPTLELYRHARSRGVAVFFITGRPQFVAAATIRNLQSAGYDQGWDGIDFKPSGPTTEAYKSARRKAIEDRGYDIIANVGDQESDLDGGHADRAFKLPNPFYFIADG